MVDADTGDLLWSASSSGANLNIPNLNYSIPAALTPVDVNGNGYVDMVFGADTGGQIFRIDINQTNAGASSFATGGVIAKLSGVAAADARRFFEPVSVAIGQSGTYLNIAAGSGFRANPTDATVDDRIYVIRDPNVNSAPASYDYSPSGGPYTEAD